MTNKLYINRFPNVRFNPLDVTMKISFPWSNNGWSDVTICTSQASII